MTAPVAQKYDFAVIGAGIVGLAVARALHTRRPNAAIAVFEKEADHTLHASGRNSGVLHAGFYYKPGSLKARFCLEGNKAWRAFCAERGIPVLNCGKLVVASDERETEQLQVLFQRGLENGSAVELLTASAAAEIEPNAVTRDFALFSPHTGAVDPRTVAQALVDELDSHGVKTIRNAGFTAPVAPGRFLTTAGPVDADVLINCAGLYADRIAQRYGFGKNYTIVPFKGLYLSYTLPQPALRVHVYPVPNPKYPFLGVHFTKTATGKTKIGPTAIPAFWRENYKGFSRFSATELAEIVWNEARLFATNAFGFRSLAFEEMRKYSRAHMIRLAKALVPSIDPRGFGDFLPAGMRAQLLDRRTLELVQDFVIEGDADSVHVLNAVSPGFTCALPFGEYIVDEHVLKRDRGS